MLKLNHVLKEEVQKVDLVEYAPEKEVPRNATVVGVLPMYLRPYYAMIHKLVVELNVFQVHQALGGLEYVQQIQVLELTEFIESLSVLYQGELERTFSHMRLGGKRLDVFVGWEVAVIPVNTIH